MVSDHFIIPETITSEEVLLVESQLKTILDSKFFKSAKQMQRFLKFIVEKTIEGEGRTLKQYTIGVEALLFSNDFNPDENPAVRILGGRIRQRLVEYYAVDRDVDELIISIPKGSYIPEFERNSHTKKIRELDSYLNPNVSEGPTLALASFTDKTQSNHFNQFLLQVTDVLATELSRFLCLKLVVCNPYSDRDQSHLVEADMRATDRSEYILAMFLQQCGDGENKYRLVYRLVLVQTGEVLWSDNYVITGRPINEQDYKVGKITATVADHLQGVMHTHWSRRLMTDLESIPDQYKVLVNFRNHTDHLDADSVSKGVKSCLDALDRNPNDVIANMIYAAYCRRDYIFGYGVVESPLETGMEYIQAAIRLSPSSHEAHYVHGLILFYQMEWKRSTEVFELVRSICKNNIVTEFGIGFHLWKMGQWEKGLKLVNKAMLLSTNYPSYYHLVPCLDFYRQGKYEEALYEAKKITTPTVLGAPLARCLSYAELGMKDEAQKEFQEVLRRDPEFIEKGKMYLIRCVGTGSLFKKAWDSLSKVAKLNDD